MPIKKNIISTQATNGQSVNPFQVFATTYKTFKSDYLNFILHRIVLIKVFLFLGIIKNMLIWRN